MTETRTKRRVCVVTGTRAEYGLLRRLMGLVRASGALELQVVATGMHLSPEFGLTWREIEQDGFAIDRRVECLLSSDTPVAIGKSIGLGTIGFAEAFASLQPDLLVVLGDRFEILAAVSAALVQRIPVAHLHGGETTEGAFDEAIRHAVTKMSHLHFVAAEPYRRRVIQLGEHPDRVFLVGGLGVDAILHTPRLSRAELEASLGASLGDRHLLVTFHPVTLEHATAADQFGELLAALDAVRDATIVFTLPNADTDGRVIVRMIEQFVATHPNALSFASLGQRRYLSCLALAEAVVGNSSSGLAEAPSFRVPTVNIGDRQRGRLSAGSVIDCAPARDDIAAALARARSPSFRATLAGVRNPYGEGGAAEAIVDVLARVPLDGLVRKSFHDIDGHALAALPGSQP